jgi:uncharacterized ferritin-like protein (DUF455 family)
MTAAPRTINQFAEQILFSDALARKLDAPGELQDDMDSLGLHRFKTPDYPARPAGLSLSRTKSPNGASEKVSFPSRASLSSERSRGLVLHFFANHELLALELMALALLKWPDASTGFRRGLVRTMLEEQSHMRLYLHRMQELHVEFGEARLNSFFWDCLKDLKSPVEFSAAMAMTFEQANIDFALHYETVFRQEGDLISAAIMKQVRDEEIGHVKHGVVWFERWRPKCETLFREWQNHLTFPITPARAKGICFDREGRIRAGLPQDFIDELEVHNQSKGRPPRLFLFNPGCEHEIEAKSNNWTAPKSMQQLESDYASIMGLLGHASDVVLVDQLPSVEHLRNLQDAGFTNPEFILKSQINALKVRKFWSFEPWGWSPKSRKLFKPVEDRLLQEAIDHDQSGNSSLKSVFSKTVASDIRTTLQLNHPPTLKCASQDEVKDAIKVLSHLSPSATVVLKTSFSASGRGMIRIKDENVDVRQEAWIRSNIDKNGHVLVEPWLEKVLDLSAHVDISSKGVVTFIGFTRFWTDIRGQYKGHIIGRQLDDCGPEILELWHRDGGWRSQLQATALAAGQEIHKLGYYGPMGVDAFVYRENGEMKLRPLVEINPRYSMGRIALGIMPRITAKHCGVWIHVSTQDAQSSKHESLLELSDHLKKIHPLDYSGSDKGRTISHGVLALNDPSQAKQSLALLVVGRHLRQCYDVLSDGGIHDPYLELQTKAGR